MKTVFVDLKASWALVVFPHRASFHHSSCSGKTRQVFGEPFPLPPCPAPHALGHRIPVNLRKLRTLELVSPEPIIPGYMLPESKIVKKVMVEALLFYSSCPDLPAFMFQSGWSRRRRGPDIGKVKAGQRVGEFRDPS